MKLINLCSMFLLLSSTVYASCNFNTSNHINEILKPDSISSIEIKVFKSSKYFQNAFKILTTRSTIILPKYKKRFKSLIVVNYKFGSCEYQGSVRQHGDYKDHIKFISSGGEVLSSLDVKLEEGNILNAVRFKLLLPETRNGKDEIFASLILRNNGFISPETSEIEIDVNGSKSVMLFQEAARKELLERNLRREGPIFEGDESLLWAYENFNSLELERLALSRLESKNWFKKGYTSQKITIEALSRLQQSYLQYTVRRKDNNFRFAIFPNHLRTNDFINYSYAMLALRGAHGLFPNNRKYYFNAIESKFEPIYYDGNINLDGDMPIFDSYKYLFPISPSSKFIEELYTPLNLGKILQEFQQRVIMPKQDAEMFFLKRFEQFKKNQELLKSEINNYKFQKNKIDQEINFEDYLKLYEKFEKIKGIDQLKITKINRTESGFNLFSSDGKKFYLTTNELSELLNRNRISGKRAIFLVPFESLKTYDVRTINIENNRSKIFMSNGINVFDFDIDKKIIKFEQKNSNDWVLLSGGDFSSWDVFFKGAQDDDNFEIYNRSQRFNDAGLTGCLNVYKSTIDEVSFEVHGGYCEDSLNIMNSKGNNISISIQNSFADAVDLDFSSISINKLKINNAGNDCLDVSGGTYKIKEALLIKCGDKGISAGERSVLNISSVFIEQSKIGLASKDFSILEVNNLQVKDVLSCGEAYQKKQEFGGAILAIDSSNCLSKIKIDQNSKFVNNY